MNNFWANKKVLVTGGTGFIGSNMVKELIKRRAVVTVSVQNNNSSNLLGKVKFEQADLTKMEDCLRVTKNIDIVLNFAALDGGSAFKKEHSEEIYRVNTRIVKNILEASRQNNVDRVLLMSSIDIYPKGTKSSISEEDADMNSKDGYVGSKIFSENLAKEYYDRYGLKIAIARPGNVYGPGDTVSPKRARVIPTFIKKAIDGETIEILNSTKLSFLYVYDLIEALLDLTERHAICNPVNLVGSEKVSLEDLAKIIIKISNSNSRIVNKNRSIKEDRLISTKKAKQVINFKDKTKLENGLRLLLGV